MLKKPLYIILMLGILFVGGSLLTTAINNQRVVSAAVVDNPADKACIDAPDSVYCKTRFNPIAPVKNPITKTIGKAVQLFAIIGGVVAVIWIIYGGFRFVKSDGDSGRIEEARKTILYGVVGLVVLLIAQVIVTFILKKVK